MGFPWTYESQHSPDVKICTSNREEGLRDEKVQEPEGVWPRRLYIKICFFSFSLFPRSYISGPANLATQGLEMNPTMNDHGFSLKERDGVRNLFIIVQKTSFVHDGGRRTRWLGGICTVPMNE